MKPGFISGILFVLALILAVCFSSSLEPTAPGLVVVALAPVLLTGALAGNGGKRSWFFAALVLAAGGYAAWRAATSPVQDYGRSDGLLLACGLAGCLWAGWLVDRRAVKVVAVGLALLALANVVIGLVQWHDPAYTPFFAGRKTQVHPSGLYGHYNHFANFLLAVGFLAAGCALLPGSKRYGRIGWSVVALICGGGIALSQSRGALVGCAVGSLVLLLSWLLDLKRRGGEGFKAAVLALVVILPILGLGGWSVVKTVLKARDASSRVEDVMVADSGRLEFASSALEMTGNHPLFGGGSRSFSYEVFKYWNPNELWIGTGDIEYVHNELLQAATDYGWLGFFLITGLLLAVGLRGAVVLFVKPEEKEREPAAGLTAGALAAIAAVLTQSMFSFVFHMAPDVLVLGLLIGIVISQPWPFGKSSRQAVIWLRPTLWVATIFAVGLAGFGWRDARAWWIVARPGSEGLSILTESRYDALQQALAVRPDFRMEQGSAELAARLAREEGELSSGQWIGRTIEHLDQVIIRHPENYASHLRLAHYLDERGSFREAEQHYLKVLPLLDSREKFYRARFAYGSHAFRQADAFFRARRPSEALAWALEARRQMQFGSKLWFYPPDSAEGRELQRLERFIKWLEDAQVAAQPDVVPVLPDPKI